MAVGGIAKIEAGKDFHKFQRFLVDGYEFGTLSDIIFNFRHPNLSFSLVYEGAGIIEYSFNGNTVHGDMTAGAVTEAIFFDNRNVPGIWFRVASGAGGNVRVEGWALR